MTKIAAALPFIAGLSAPAALGIGAALTGGSALLNAQGQKKHTKAQNAANQQWLDYQRGKTAQFERQDEANRAAAANSLEANLSQGTGEAREAAIATEEDRLADMFGSEQSLAQTAEAMRGSGQNQGTSDVFDTEMARSLGNATAEARKRIEAMARSTAYGGGSMGSMGMLDALRNQETATDLGGINTNRRGDTASLTRYSQVQPEMLEYEQSPLIPIMNAAGSFFLGGGPKGLADMLANGAKTAATAATSSGTNPMGMVSAYRPTYQPEQFSYRMGPGVPF